MFVYDVDGLEVIATHAPGTGPRALFVHGACTSARCWARFLPWFAARGIPVVALSLRGHGASRPHAFGEPGIRDYADDVIAASRALGGPALVAHSMGAFVVQHALARHPDLAARAVLLAPAPSRTMAWEGAMLFWRRPWAVWQALVNRDLRTLYTGAGGLAELLLPADAPPELAAELRSYLEPESWRAGEEMNRLMPDWVRGRSGGVATLVLAGGRDPIISPGAGRQTAQDWRAQFRLLPEMGHLLQLEPGWEAVAEAVRAWVAPPEDADPAA